MYDNMTATPTVLLFYPEAAPGGRTGDLFTVTGNYSRGTAKYLQLRQLHLHRYGYWKWKTESGKLKGPL